MPKQKVIIWGYTLDSHTHSYIHGAWYKTFKHLGYDTYWFHDQNYPVGFDYSNALFITEGYAEKNIPLVESSTYFVHICVNPQKYLKRVVVLLIFASMSIKLMTAIIHMSLTRRSL